MLRIWEQLERDRKNLLESTKRSAADHDPKGLYEMGIRYFFSWEVPFDLGKALECFTLAAEAGHAGAYYELARLYLYGMEGIPKDPTKGYHYIEKGLTNNSTRFDTDSYKCSEVIRRLESMKAAIDYLKEHPFPSSSTQSPPSSRLSR